MEYVALSALTLTAGTVLVTLDDRRRRVALATLLGISAGLMAAQIAGAHIFTLACAAWGVAMVSLKPRRSKTPWALLLLAAAVILSSTAAIGAKVNSPTLGLQLVALAASAAVIATTTHRSDSDAILGGLLWITTLSSLVALAQVAGVVPSNLWHRDVSSLGRPTGIYPEPDWLGLFAAVALVISWRLPMRPRARTLVIVLNATALALSFARAAWLALAITIATQFALARLTHVRVPRTKPHSSGATPPHDRGRRTALLTTVALSAVALFVLPNLRSDLFARLGSILSPAETDVSAQARLNQMETLRDLATSAPWYGWGLSASGSAGVFGGIVTNSTNNVGSNWILSWWLEGGLLAVPLIAVVALVMWKSWPSIPAQGLLVTVVNSLFSNAMYQPLPWALLALSIVEITEPKAEDQQGPSQSSSPPRVAHPRGSRSRDTAKATRQEAQRAQEARVPLRRTSHNVRPLTTRRPPTCRATPPS